MSRNIWFVLAMLGIMCVLLVGSVWNKTLCYDEQAHWDYGRRVLSLQTARTGIMDDSKMPVSALNALVWPLLEGLGLQQALIPDYKELPPEKREETIRAKTKQLAVKTGRAATIMATLLFGLLVFSWSRELYGTRAGLFSLALYVLSPNILAHGRFVTTDIYGMGCIALAGYAYWRYCVRPSVGRCCWAGASLGLAQLAKFSSVYFVLIDCVLLLPFVPELMRTLRSRGWSGLRLAAVHLLLFMLTALFVLNAGFLFQGTLRPLRSYTFESSLFKRLQAESGVLSGLPLPLPAAFVTGLDMVKAHEQSGQTFGKLYLHGRCKDLSKGEGGFENYYLWVMLYKFPLPLLLLCAWTLFSFCGAKAKEERFWRREWFLLCPAGCYLLILNYLNHAQIGIRHLLVVSPFLFIACGRLLRASQDAHGHLPRFRVVCLGLLLAWQLVSVCSYFPHFVSYFNELSWDRKNNWRLLADSNLEWGQNGRYLERYLRAHPDARVNPRQPCCGLVVVDSNMLTGVLSPESDFAWLRDTFEPTDHVAYGYIVYDIPQRDCIDGKRQ